MLVRPLFEALGVTDVELMTLLVRKCAHFSEYAVLGVLGWNLFGRLRALGEARRPWGALLVAAVPVLDETLQLFVPGRSGSPVDVCIDLAGVATGALLTALLFRER